MAELKLTTEEIKTVLEDILCNGFMVLPDVGLSYSRNDAQYKDAYNDIRRQKYSKRKGAELPCYEDVLLRMLEMGYPLSIVDEDCDGAYSKELTMELVKTNIGKCNVVRVNSSVEGTTDAWDAFNILQEILYGELIFG